MEGRESWEGKGIQPNTRAKVEHLEKSRIAREKFKAKRKAELEEIKRKIAEATNANAKVTETNDL